MHKIGKFILLIIFMPFIFEKPTFAECFRIKGNPNSDSPVDYNDKIVCTDNFSRDYTLTSGGGSYNSWSIGGNCTRDSEGNLENEVYSEKKSFLAMPITDLVNQHKNICNQFFDPYE